VVRRRGVIEIRKRPFSMLHPLLVLRRGRTRYPQKLKLKVI